MNQPIPNVALPRTASADRRTSSSVSMWAAWRMAWSTCSTTCRQSEFRHAIICVTDYTAFRDRLNRIDVEVYSLHKPPGNSLRTHAKVWKLLRALKPTIVHTRNLAALEFQIAAAAAGVPVRIHGEHGWDMRDLDGRNRRYLAMKRFVRPFVHHYIGLSRHIERYLRESVRIPRSQRVPDLQRRRHRPVSSCRDRTDPAPGPHVRRRRPDRHRYRGPHGAGQGSADARAGVRATDADGARDASSSSARDGG